MTIDLTAILITAIICLAICYAMDIVAKYLQDKKEKTSEVKKAIEIPSFVNQTKCTQAQHLVERMKEKETERGKTE